MTGTSCLGTASCILKIFYWKERRTFWFSSVILLNFLPKNQSSLDYFWEFSRNWEILQKWQLCMGDWIKALIKKIFYFCAFCLFVCISLYGVHYLFQLALYNIVRCPLLISTSVVQHCTVNVNEGNCISVEVI